MAYHHTRVLSRGRTVLTLRVSGQGCWDKAANRPVLRHDRDGQHAAPYDYGPSESAIRRPSP